MAGILQEEYPFSFIGNPSSLQFLASSELVLNLWRFKYFNRPASERNNDTSASWFLENISCSSDEITGLPSCMKKAIDEKIEKIRDRLFLWICYHSSLRVFDGDFRDVFFKCFNSIVLNQHGIIGYKETASNLVKLADFSYDEKYEIACEYCLEDDVKRIWPFVSNELRTADDKYSLIYFWNCRMSSTYDSFKIITRFQRAYKNWEAFEYLFNLLPDEQKISNTVSFLKHTNDKAFLRSLRKLNRDLACEVFQLQACRILSTLMKKEEYIWHLLELWAAVKVPVFEKPTVFFDILNDLWKRVFNGCCSDYVGIDQINCLLIEVWTSAPDELKSFILNRHVDHFFDKLFLSEKKFDYYYGHDVTFLLQLFVNSNYEVRSKLWQKNWRKLVLRAKPWCLEQFMRSVFPNEDTIEDFKRRFMFGFKPILDCFCILGKYPDFNDYLHFLSKDPKIILDLGKRALKSNVGAIVIWLKDTDKARKFNEFVSSIFSNTVEDIANFKEHLISCHRAIEALYSVHYDFCVKEIDVAVDAFSMSGEKLKKLKHKCLDFSRGHLMTDQALYFSRYGWQRWLKWCTANDKEISAFRKSLNIDEILDKQVTNFGKKFELYMKEYEGGLYFFNQFAEWYFPNDEVRKKFKLRKIKNFKKNSAIMDILKSGVRFKISTMVEWFFEDDFDKSREFLSSLYGTRNS